MSSAGPWQCGWSQSLQQVAPACIRASAGQDQCQVKGVTFSSGVAAGRALLAWGRSSSRQIKLCVWTHVILFSLCLSLSFSLSLSLSLSLTLSLSRSRSGVLSFSLSPPLPLPVIKPSCSAIVFVPASVKCISIGGGMSLLPRRETQKGVTQAALNLLARE